MGNCRYCDGWKVSAGGACRHSPIGTHVVDEGPNRCIYCDLYYASSSATCSISPSGYHVLGTVENTPEEYEASTPALIWVSILVVFGILALPLLFIFNWNLDTLIEKIILIIAFLLSLYVGFKFSYIILRTVGYILSLVLIGVILYLLIIWIFKFNPNLG